MVGELRVHFLDHRHGFAALCVGHNFDEMGGVALDGWGVMLKGLDLLLKVLVVAQIHLLDTVHPQIVDSQHAEVETYSSRN